MVGFYFTGDQFIVMTVPKTGFTALSYTTLGAFSLITLGLVVGASYELSRRFARDDRFFPKIVLLFSSLYLALSTLFYQLSMKAYGAPVIGGTANSWYQFALTTAGKPLGVMLPPPDFDFYFVIATLSYSVPEVGWLLPLLINYFFALVLLAYVFRTARSLGDERLAKNAVKLLVFVPTLYPFTYHLSPDLITTTLTVVAVFYFIRVLERKDARSFGIASIITLSVFLFRIKSGLLLLVAMGVALTVGISLNTERRDIRAISALGFLFLPFLLLYYYLYIWGSRARSGTAVINSFVWSHLADAAGLASLFAHLPPSLRGIFGVLPFLIMPFPPWVIFNGGEFWQVMFGVEAIAIYFLFPFAVVGATTLLQRVSTRTLPIFVYTTMLIVGISVYYAGMVPRFRFQAVPFLLIFAVVGFEYYRPYRRALALFWLGYPALILLYLLIK